MNDEADTPVDPRIDELVSCARSAREIVLGAEYLLSEWVIQYFRRFPLTFPLEQHPGMRPERRFRALLEGYADMMDDLDSLDRAVFGFFRDLYPLRAATVVLPEDELLERLVEVYRRHGGEEAREDCAESYDRLGLMQRVVAGYLAYAQGWLTSEEWPEDWDPEAQDDGIEVEDPGWDAREGGSCNFVMGD